ncbi:SGNH/GDSL hydrolase family protein [Vitiosangium sp. GDMCC 1.1324]|uniref:SGNH/GDSL hydrolase family protein n=1 Tax=Vitiosangium sp. (strain GDMCC 1.1324) TaxID=2138576 RepID=UPI000D35F173|nr:SGNH/GDSL hydrolase family protein [Vitiosangium sp. GDMCC 1.1324]PTL80563.1 GDSL family lipase [Vitiosangium sp. GDMCC 1.1324]
MSALSLRYVALGDSSAVGVGARQGGYVEHLFQRLRRTRPGVGLLNLAVSGATSATVLSGQLPKAMRSRPHVVTLAVGINDLWRGVEPHPFESNLDQLARGLVGTGAAVVLANLPDMSLAPVARLATHFLPLELISARIAAFNAAVARVVSRHGLIGVDLHTPSLVELPGSPDYFSADGFHPSDTGYTRMAEHFWPSLLHAAERAVPTAQATG